MQIVKRSGSGPTLFGISESDWKKFLENTETVFEIKFHKGPGIRAVRGKIVMVQILKVSEIDETHGDGGNGSRLEI